VLFLQAIVQYVLLEAFVLKVPSHRHYADQVVTVIANGVCVKLAQLVPTVFMKRLALALHSSTHMLVGVSASLLPQATTLTQIPI
jgi:hypothetical protein